MAVYEYQAVTRGTGKKVKGVIDADTAAVARRKLREQQLVATRLVESFGKSDGAAGAQGNAVGGRIKQAELALTTRQLAVLLRAGMPLVEALSALLAQTTNPRLHKIIYDVRTRVNEGSRLAQALQAHPRVFNQLYVNMVAAGEASGALEAVLFRLADLTERQVKLRHRITAMLLYPSLMALVGLGMVTFLMMVVVPKITGVFARQGTDLPAITKVMLGICYTLQDYWWAIGAALVCAVLLWRIWVSRDSGRRAWDRMKLRNRLTGPLYTKMLTARFARTLGTMLESGLTMMPALDVVRTVVQNRVVEEALDDVKAGVRRGRDLAVPLKETGFFPPMMIHMVDLGQRSGELEQMMLQVADNYENEVELTVDALVSLLEPVMIIVMGFFVGFLVAAIMLPVLQISNTV